MNFYLLCMHEIYLNRIFPNAECDTTERLYLVCCRDGYYRECKRARLTDKQRPHQKDSRKLNDTCISRMYVDVKHNGHVRVTYISAHTNHVLGPSEDAYIPLPKSVREEIALKLSCGIPPDRIMEGKQDDLYNIHNMNSKLCMT